MLYVLRAAAAMCIGFTHRRTLATTVRQGRSSFSASLHLVLDVIAYQVGTPFVQHYTGVRMHGSTVQVTLST